MGIEVSAAKVVTINDTHENGVDTSVAANPTDGRLKGIPLVHVFSRNQKSARRDDGNPLIYALKVRRGFSISAYWEQQLLARAAQILDKVKPNLVRFDHCMPIPSSSPFCARFADIVSVTAEAPILDSAFLRKAQVGELLAAAEANPPKVRSGLKGALATQLHAWGKMDQTATYQAKEVDLGLRHLFQTFVLDAEAPDIKGKRILVVDDLFATGSSLLSAREILQNQLGAEVAGVCFLSGV